MSTSTETRLDAIFEELQKLVDNLSKGVKEEDIPQKLKDLKRQVEAWKSSRHQRPQNSSLHNGVERTQ